MVLGKEPLLLRELIKQRHRGKWGGPNPKIPNHVSDKYGGILWQNGHQWTRLAELVRLPRVSARGLVSQIKLCRKNPNPNFFSNFGMEEFLLQPQIMYIFVKFRNQGSQHIAVRKAPGQVPAGAPRRVSMEFSSFRPEF